jgi:hypothetical protein
LSYQIMRLEDELSDMDRKIAGLEEQAAMYWYTLAV